MSSVASVEAPIRAAETMTRRLVSAEEWRRFRNEQCRPPRPFGKHKFNGRSFWRRHVGRWYLDDQAHRDA